MIANGLTVGFQVTEDGCPLERATERTGTSIRCVPPPQLRYDGNVLLRAHVKEGGTDLVESLRGDDRVSHVFVSNGEQRSTVRCLSGEPSSLHALTNAGFLPTTVRYVKGTGFFKGEVVGRDVLKNVLQAAGSTVGVHVQNIYQINPNESDPLASRGELHWWNLTSAQEEALKTAYQMGYFEIPRKVTTDDIAAELDISKSAVLQRIQRAERTVIEKLFDEETIT